MNNFKRLFTKNIYTVAYRICNEDIMDDTGVSYKYIDINNEYWCADPFVYHKNGDYYVFMEVMINEKGYAGIGVSTLLNGVLTEPEIVIDYGKHLSFPLVFDFNGEIYMMPESCSECKIKLFRCIDFPYKWEEYSFISDERGFYDTVPFKYKDKYYLFTSHSTADMYGSKLYLMETNGNIKNPKIISEKKISDDYRYSRQAGKMIVKDGNLIRVAQDCSKNEYGKALEFLMIEDIENYSESEIKRIKPSDLKFEKKLRNIEGVHTYNRVNNFEVIDLKLSKFYPKAFFVKTKIILNMIFKR